MLNALLFKLKFLIVYKVDLWERLQQYNKEWGIEKGTAPL